MRIRRTPAAPAESSAATDDKHQLKVLLSPDEKKMLDALAKVDEMAIADVIRQQIRRAHAERFAADEKRAQRPTVRGIIDDVCGAAHYFARDIATRTGLPLSIVLSTLWMLDEKRVLQRVSGGDGDSTWASRLVGGLMPTIEAAERARIPLDRPLDPKGAK